MEYIEWEKVRNKTILITGATGLIGTTLVNGLAYSSRERNLKVKIICLVRDRKKAIVRLHKDADIRVVSLDQKIEIDEPIDYIIHAANPTSSSYFIKNPVETIMFAVDSTTNLLRLARKNNVEGFIYLSSMEVYGYPEKEHVVSEEEVAGFNTMVIRNCYPQSKQICEMLCKSYQSEYGVPAKVVRLTQTFGAGVEYNDGRIFTEFMRCVIEKKDIILHTEGKTERCYLYTVDAVTAILTILTKGEPGEAYTVANPDTYCSIIDMAKMVTSDVAGNDINVKIEVDNVDRGYAPELYMKLDISKIEGLGWEPIVGLRQMYHRMIENMEVSIK